MLVLYDPVSSWFGHAKPDVGVLVHLHRLHPEQPITYFGCHAHLEGIRYILRDEGIGIPKLDLKPIPVVSSTSPDGFIRTCFHFYRVLSWMKAHGTHRLFILSLDGPQIFILKYLRRYYFRELKVIATVHGNFEALGDISSPTIVIPETHRSEHGLLYRMLKCAYVNYLNLKSKAYRYYESLFLNFFPLKDQVTQNPFSGDFTYIVLAHFIRRNLEPHIDVNRLRFVAVPMPFTFLAPQPSPSNPSIVFATFGVGDNLTLAKVMSALDRMKPSKPYVVRVIGMDNRGLTGLPHVQLLGKGAILTRDVMDREAPDVDVFLILYAPHRYRFGCSTSIFEAMSRRKPVIHLNSDMFAEFNRPELPIGYRCSDIQEIAETMYDLIENFQERRADLETRRRNMLTVRQRLDEEAHLTLGRIWQETHISSPISQGSFEGKSVHTP